MRKKYVLVVVAIVAAFSFGYGALASAWPDSGDAEYRGYFRNQRDTSGDHVWNPGQGPSACRGGSAWAIPSWVNSKSEFIAFVECKLTRGNAQERVGASFIIQTMRGGNSTRHPPTQSQINDWKARVNNPSLNVTWSSNRSYTINTYYQGCCGGGSNPVDDAYFNDSGSGSSIVFHVPGQDYVLRRQCANPVGNGSLGELPPGQDFNIDGSTTVNGGTSAEVLPGDEVDFRHSLVNRGPTSTSPTTVNWSTPSVGPASGNSGNAGTFNNGQTKRPSAARQTFTVPASATPGTRYCSRIFFNPNTENGGSSQSAERCATVQYDYDLEPRINVTILDVDGQDVSTDGVAEAGYTIEFTYSVRNGGLTVSQNVNCTYHQAAHSGYNESAPTATFVPPGANCPPPRAFPRNSTTTTAVENISGGAVSTNTTICRSFTISPTTQDGGTETVQACVPVVAKPYSRVYGGDVSAGNGLTTAPGVCTNNNSAAVVGWNRRSAATYAGAGAQYAVMALDEINDFSTALGNSGGAPRPHGLAFANTSTNVGSGLFGGEFGSVPCIPDYYANRPDGAPSASSNLSSHTSGTYTYDGTLSLSGNVNPGEFITIYVDGDVHITGDIRYPGNWSVDNIPVFQLIVQGNIFIDNDVDQVDGVYIAQADGASGGVIHTCSLSAAALPLDGGLYDACNNKLTINGAFIANQVRLLRTSGTLSQSNAGEGSGASAGGEVFNFNPALWLRQPEAPAGETGDYDAIISLPPIL